MEQGLVAEMWWSLVVIGVCSVLIRVCHEVWLKPRRIKSMLWRQGIRGPQPSFPYGNISEMQKIQFSMINNTSDGQPVSENWTHSLFPYLQQWRQEYGPVYMYSTGSKQHLYVSDPELLRELRLKSLNNSFDLGRSSYRGRPFQPLVGDGIIGANGSNWAYQRKLIAPKFFLSKVKNMVGVIELSTIAMMKTWENRIIESEGGVTDMIIDEDLKSLSADIISRACFGSSYSQGNQIFSKITSLQYALSKQSVLLGLFNFRFLPTKCNREIWRLKKEVDTQILKVVKDCQQKIHKGTIPEKNLLQLTLESAVASDDKVPREFNFKTDRFIVDLCKNIYFAGHETTAVAASWILMLLALHPEWQERVRTEILEVCGDQLSNLFQDMEAFHKLKMLTMVIQEGIRLYGPSVVTSREAFADIKLGEFVVPKGVHLWFFAPALHCDPENWGLDALEFKPERFAHGISKACKYPQAYIPFGFGSRLCIGQTFALLELKVVLSLILSNFSFSLSPEYRHSPVYKLVLTPQHGERLLVTKLQGSHLGSGL